MSRALHTVSKEYPCRGPMQQFRIDAAKAFHCFRCGVPKKAKLVAVYAGDWRKLLCNGCYGFLLSVYDIKAGSGDEGSKAGELAGLLLGRVKADEVRRAAEQALMSDRRASLLSPPALRFLGTSDFVARGLSDDPSLDWSPAVIGLCKAVEVELVTRLMTPLRNALAGRDLTPDLDDRDLGRVAKYCAGRADTPPELGSVRHFLHTAAHSKTRAASSPMIAGLRELTADWPRCDWLFVDDGAIRGLEYLTKDFRNRAAHIDELSRREYRACWELVAGPQGLLWSLVSATSDRKALQC